MHEASKSAGLVVLESLLFQLAAAPPLAAAPAAAAAAGGSASNASEPTPVSSFPSFGPNVVSISSCRHYFCHKYRLLPIKTVARF